MLVQIMYIVKIKREKSDETLTIWKLQRPNQVQALVIPTESVESDLGLFIEEWCIQEGCSGLNSVQIRVHQEPHVIS